ncbi:hypothetical protein PF010_g7957 [Phytophthora fragariae]|uniref:Uncharacterized protein n=1 Tax=Phytophthora fragariae TaxID=53985 RepID=A0A6A3SP02_9STRA|nr:hypothetical protein PF003_g22738 [Phytophthora fragariae]KAE8941708.1 hypothetical protein PF009_g8495 [Phytophthora fragariae]KAE9017875.1 hypothetical protein PF011_g6517 [Phytophthora fragariae]KAE9119196.1 hypothetical protein PF010_g7957 [Phytophthora fragariae]KAE9119967.1 hypothetical protein PF007_g8350 [Phytophthora fragariae]
MLLVEGQAAMLTVASPVSLAATGVQDSHSHPPNCDKWRRQRRKGLSTTRHRLVKTPITIIQSHKTPITERPWRPTINPAAVAPAEKNLWAACCLRRVANHIPAHFNLPCA